MPHTFSGHGVCPVDGTSIVVVNFGRIKREVKVRKDVAEELNATVAFIRRFNFGFTGATTSPLFFYAFPHYGKAEHGMGFFDVDGPNMFSGVGSILRTPINTSKGGGFVVVNWYMYKAFERGGSATDIFGGINVNLSGTSLVGRQERHGSGDIGASRSADPGEHANVGAIDRSKAFLSFGELIGRSDL